MKRKSSQEFRDETNSKIFNIKPFLQEDFIEILYQPHTLTVLFAAISIVAYYAIYDISSSTDVNIRRGIVAIFFIFLVYCAIQLRDGFLLRPHPIIWRIVRGIGIIYCSVLVFLLFQTRDDTRQFLKYFYPNLGVPLEEKSYANDCRLYTPENPNSIFFNFKNTLWDEYAVAHAVGYILKALLVRDLKLLWCISIGFELLEITFQHVLNNFHECWWDHLFLDILGCNLFGIIIGLNICNFFKIKRYPLWIGITKIKTTPGKIKRALEQFTPYNWTSYEWEIFSTAPAIREYYEFISNRKCQRIGDAAWIALLGLILEFLICVKYGRGLFKEPFPSYIWIPWTIFFTLGSIWCFLFFYFKKKSKFFKISLNLLITLAFLSLLFMSLAGLEEFKYGRKQFDQIEKILMRLF
eukprot:gene1051-10570_t